MLHGGDEAQPERDAPFWTVVANASGSPPASRISTKYVVRSSGTLGMGA